MADPVVLALVGIAGSLLIAVGGYLFTYFADRHIAERAGQLDRVNRQLRDLYGPLYWHADAGHRSWLAFRREWRPGVDFFEGESSPSDEDLIAWRLWMTRVFQPRHEQLVAIIGQHADLLDEPAVPTCLLELAAHVDSFRAILHQWEQDNYTAHAPPIPFPKDLGVYAKEIYELLKLRQAELLGADR